MSDACALTHDEAVRAAELVTMIVTTFPPLVAVIGDEDAALIRAGIDAAERHLRHRDALMPILAAHAIGDDPKLATKQVNIRIVRAVLALRDAVRQGVAEEQATTADRDAFDAQRRHLLALVGMGE